MQQKIGKNSERGSAIVIALLVLSLLLVFVALSVSRVTSETIATGNDTAETRSSKAAEAGLEVATQELDNIFNERISPVSSDLDPVRAITSLPNMPDQSFLTEVTELGTRQVMETEGPYVGLTAVKTAYLVSSTATDTGNGVKVKLSRGFSSNRVPIFQFGIFNDDDLEFHPGPRFDFGGRVHTNANLFLAGNDGLYFRSKVTAVGEVLTDVARNGMPVGPNSSDQWKDNVYIRDSSGTPVKLGHDKGSALNKVTTGAQVLDNNDGYPNAYVNNNWATTLTQFNGSLGLVEDPLRLPLRISDQTSDYIELIKRGKNIGDMYNDGAGTVTNPSIVPVTAVSVDPGVTSQSRYANQEGIRISLADSQQKLPGCANVPVGTYCGVRLDDGNGYQPVTMDDGYKATALNGFRFTPRITAEFFTSSGLLKFIPSPISTIPPRGVWIKAELTSFDTNSNTPVSVDVTADILSLGVTEAASCIPANTCNVFGIQGNYHAERIDTRSIVKLQRFMIPGVKIENPYNTTNSPFLTDYNLNGITHNLVVAEENGVPLDHSFAGESAHLKDAIANSNNVRILPFPIRMFDTREGLYNDNINASVYQGEVPRNGVMSMIDVDVANLRRFLRGDFDNVMPKTTPYASSNGGQGLKASQVPSKNGWVLYISDRRGDRDFDGEYDMENVYVNNQNMGGNPSPDPGEDVNKSNSLERDYNNGDNSEAPTYADTYPPDYAAAVDDSFYRRGVRLINGETLPGKYSALTPEETRGFTVASENAVYVQGNYNATHVSSFPSSSGPTPSSDYQPQNTTDHIPASIVADAVTILSRNWKDSNSFRSPFNYNERVATETTVRFAMIAGDAVGSLNGTPNQGGGDPRMAGGVHNFKRFLEKWGGSGGTRLNYTGSLINLYNAHNNNGTFKCCSKVYEPPNRNWAFDESFLDASRLPPATPYFQYLQITGFQRVNN